MFGTHIRIPQGVGSASHLTWHESLNLLWPLMKSIVKKNIHYVSNHDEHVKNDINNINNGFNANNYLGSMELFF